MTREELSNHIEELTTLIMENNSEKFADAIFSGIDEDASPYEFMASAISSSCNLAVRLSVEMTINILIESGVLKLDEIDYISPKPDFKVITGGLGFKPKDRKP